MDLKRVFMGKLSETELKRLIQGGETNTVELKVAAPRATEMAERLCGLANAQGGLVIIEVKDSTYEIVGVSDRTAHRNLETLVERGRLKGTGQKSARRYVLA
jgi:predicted HTH transcriptional regulator